MAKSSHFRLGRNDNERLRLYCGLCEVRRQETADKSFNIAMGLLEDTSPQSGEASPDFLRRVMELVRAHRDAYQADGADENGTCSGALDAAMWAIIGVLPKEPLKR